MGQTLKKKMLKVSDVKMQLDSVRPEHHPCKNSNVNARHWWNLNARHWWNLKMSENCVQDKENDETQIVTIQTEYRVNRHYCLLTTDS